MKVLRPRRIPLRPSQGPLKGRNGGRSEAISVPDQTRRRTMLKKMLITAGISYLVRRFGNGRLPRAVF
jgi:hypothetical protein